MHTRHFSRYSFRYVIGFLFIVWTPLSFAILPWLSEGKDQPILAPMLQRVMPALANISIKSYVRIQQKPLFDDLFFTAVWFRYYQQHGEEHHGLTYRIR